MITVSFPGISIPVKSKNRERLKKAYDKYRKAPNDRVLQFEVENAYWHCYKKRASAKLIDKLARVGWVAFRAWDVFGKSGPAFLEYDDVEDKVRENWGFRWPKTWAVFSTISLPILYLSSAAILFGGVLFTWKLVSLLSLYSVDELVNSPKGLLLYFFLGALMPVTLGLGLGGLYVSFLSTRSTKVESDARILKRLLDEDLMDS